MGSYAKKLRQKTFVAQTPEELDKLVNDFRENEIVSAVLPNLVSHGNKLFFVNLVIFEV